MEHAAWPALPLGEWEPTYRTLHMWTQIAGKIRMALTPRVNHWWHVALYVTARGLTTSPIPYRNGAFELRFNFQAHRLEVVSSDGGQCAVALRPVSVAAFYRELMAALESMGIQVAIDTKPQEVPEAIPFERDERHASYDPEYAHRCWRILLSSALALGEFRGRFLGKASPVHFFWGSFDLACTRFSGRAAPARKGVITSDAYSHECSSAGWWPGGGPFQEPAYYAYAAPEPAGYAASAVRPAGAFYSADLHEHLFPYEEARRAASPKAALLEFFQSTYEAAARLGQWDRQALEQT